MKIGLLGTGFGRAHAAIYYRHPQVEHVVVFGRTPAKLEAIAGQFGFATTTEIDSIYDDPAIDLVDVCLPTPLHAEHAVRALRAGKHVLCELPLASTMADAHHIVDAQQASGQQMFVDMAGRFDPAGEFLRSAIADHRYGGLRTLEIATRTALLWEGYDLRLDTIVMDLLHGSLDTIVTALGRPESITAVGVNRDGRGSAVDAVLSYPDVIVTCHGSALMPTPYAVRGSYRAAFTDGVLENRWAAGYSGRATTTLTERTEHGERTIDLPDIDLYAALIDHVFACLDGQATSRVGPETTLDSLRVTLDIHHKINQR